MSDILTEKSKWKRPRERTAASFARTRRRLEVLARTVTGSKVKVSYGGTTSATDGTKVIIAHDWSAFTDDQRMASIFEEVATMHEAAGHLVYTDFTAWRKVVRDPLLKHATNLFEDARINSCLSAFYPGTKKKMEMMYRTIAVKYAENDWNASQGPPVEAMTRLHAEVCAGVRAMGSDDPDVNNFINDMRAYYRMIVTAPNTEILISYLRAVFIPTYRKYWPDEDPSGCSGAEGGYDPLMDSHDESDIEEKASEGMTGKSVQLPCPAVELPDAVAPSEESDDPDSSPPSESGEDSSDEGEPSDDDSGGGEGSASDEEGDAPTDGSFPSEPDGEEGEDEEGEGSSGDDSDEEGDDEESSDLEEEVNGDEGSDEEVGSEGEPTLDYSEPELPDYENDPEYEGYFSDAELKLRDDDAPPLNSPEANESGLKADSEWYSATSSLPGDMKILGRMIDAGSCTAYDLTSEVGRQASIYGERIKRLFTAVKADSPVGAQQFGEDLDDDMLPTWRHDFNIFETRTEPDVDDSVVYLLIDASGSMNHRNRGYQASKAAMFLAMLCEAADIPVEIVHFNSRGDGSSGSTTLHVRKTFSQSVKSRAGVISQPYASGGNCDAAAVRAACERLVRHPASQKVLFHISDGHPTETDTDGVDAATALKNAINEYAESVYMFGFGVSHDLSEFYENFLTVEDRDSHELGRELVRVAQRVLRKKLRPRRGKK